MTTARHQPAPGPTGLLLIDKPEGPTSMDVCRRVRAKLVSAGAPKRVKVGHGGTLDPLATGLVVVLIGKATKLCDRVMAGEKRYLTEIDLSVTSPSYDRETEATPVEVASVPTAADVRTAAAAFVGRIEQRPPAFSAMKVGGVRAYKLARKGASDEEVLKPRPVEIHEINVVAYEWPLVTLDIRCGKGTYIRSLARDLGERLGGGGMLTALRRTGVGRFRVAAARSFDTLPQMLTAADLDPVDPSEPKAID